MPVQQPERRQLVEIVAYSEWQQQYQNQLLYYQELGFLGPLPEKRGLGMIGIDGGEFLIPSWSEVSARLRMSEIVFKEKYEQGFTQLLLVPLALPLKLLLDAYIKLLDESLQQMKVRRADGTIITAFRYPEDRDKLQSYRTLKSADIDGSLLYLSRDQNVTTDTGQTKQELITAGKTWQVLLVNPQPTIYPEVKVDRAEAAENTIPKEKIDRKTLATTFAAGKQFTASILTIPEFAFEQGMNLETWMLLALQTVKGGRVLDEYDVYDPAGRHCYLLGCQFKDGELLYLKAYHEGDLASVTAIRQMTHYGTRTVVEIP